MKKLIVIFLCLITAPLLTAQELLTTTGNSSQLGHLNFDWSIGEIATETTSNETFALTQGFHQPFEISVVTGIENAKTIQLMFFTYPNPTTDYLTLKVDNFEFSTVGYQLFNMKGELLKSKKIKTNETQIAMDNLLPAIYFLKITKDEEEMKTFKIIKK